MPMILNGTGDITGLASVNSSVSAAEIGYLDGVTSAVQTQINARSSYLSGTFSPTAFGQASAGTTTYIFQDGFYVKLGQVVNIVINIGWSNMTGTGGLRIGNLPFTCISGNHFPALSLYNNGLSFGSGQQLGAYVSTGTKEISLIRFDTTGVVTDVPVDTAVGRLMITGIYMADS